MDNNLNEIQKLYKSIIGDLEHLKCMIYNRNNTEILNTKYNIRDKVYCIKNLD